MSFLVNKMYLGLLFDTDMEEPTLVLL